MANRSLENLRGLLDDSQHRAEFESFLEELARHGSLRYAAKLLRRSNFYAEVLEREGKRLIGHGQNEAVKTLDESLPSILEALDTALDRGDVELLLTFATRLVKYLTMVSRFKDAVTLYERLVEGARQTGNRLLQVHAHLGYGTALWRLGRYIEAENELRNAKSLAKQEGDRHLVALSTTTLGLVADNQGTYETAKKFFEESLVINKEMGNRSLAANNLNNLGNVARKQGICKDARQFYQKGLDTFRDLGDSQGMAACLNGLGIMACNEGLLEAATDLYSKALEINQENGNHSWTADNLNNLGLVAYRQGRNEVATELLDESLALKREIGDSRGIANGLHNLGIVAAYQGLYDEAIQLSQESLAIRREICSRQGIAECLTILGEVASHRGRYEKAKKFFEESLEVYRQIGYCSGMCEALAVTGNLIAAIGHLEQAATTLYGAQHHADQTDYLFDPMEQDMLDEGLKKVQGLRFKAQGKKGRVKSGKRKGNGMNSCGGLSAAELEKLKAQAEAMSLDDLVEFALKALAQLELPTPQKSTTAAQEPTTAASN